MRAVNLIPADRRRYGRAAGGQSGGAAYVVLGGLVGLLAMSGLYALAKHDTADSKAKLVAVSREANQASAQAGSLAPYAQFASLRAQRASTISAVATQRVDWALALRQIVSVLPTNVRLLSLSGSAPGAGTSAVAPGTGAATTTPGAGVGGPSFEIVGCADTHTQVADVINLLRGIPGSPQISLSSSAKSGTPAAGSGGTALANGCPDAAHHPQWDISVTYASAPGAKATAVSPAGGTAGGSAPGSAGASGANTGATGGAGPATGASGGAAAGAATAPQVPSSTNAQGYPKLSQTPGGGPATTPGRTPR